MILRWWRNKKQGRRTRQQEPVSIGRQLFFGGVIITFVVLTCVGIWYATRMPSVTIVDIDIEGGETVSHKKLRGVIEQQLTGSYFLLIPRRFTYLYPHDEILEALGHEVRIHNIALAREDNTTLRVTFDEHRPHSLWCENESETARCLFLNESGYAFSPAPPMRGGAFLRHVTEGRELINRTQIFETKALDNIEKFIGLVESEFPFRVLGVTHSDVHDVAYRVSGDGAFLVDNSVAAEETFQNLVTILGSEQFAHIAPGNFEYIDLRFGNKVFVHEGLEDAETASTSEEVVDE